MPVTSNSHHSVPATLIPIGIYICSVWLVISFPLNLLRLGGMNISWVSNGLILIVCILGLLKLPFILLKKSPLVLPFFVTVCVYSYALVLGAMKNGIVDAALGFRYFALPVAMILLLYDASLADFKTFMRRNIWILVLVGHLCGYIYYIFYLRGIIYPGIGVQSIAYAGLFFFISSNPFLFLICSLMIVLEGKRSVLLAYLITIIILATLKRFKKGIAFGSSFLILVVILIISLCLLYLLSSLETYQLLNRVNLLNPFASQYDLILGSSGRLGELISYFGNHNLTQILTGEGLGFSYEWELGYSNTQNGEIKGYFHSSIVNYMVISGIFGMSIWLYLAKVLVDTSKTHASNKDFRLSFGFFFMSISQSFFGFNTAVDPVFWLFFVLCVLVSRRIQKPIQLLTTPALKAVS